MRRALVRLHAAASASHNHIRRAACVFGFALAAQFCAGVALADQIASAHYVDPTTVYGHGALKGGEYAALEVTLQSGTKLRLRHENAVFEDTAPRLYDLTGDGAPDLVTVVSDFQRGARIQLFRLHGEALQPFAATAPIGQAHRWLAIAGIADFNGDGLPEIAYIDRPHLAKTLKLISISVDGTTTVLTPLAEAAGLTNHHFGAAEIEGGVRTCPGQLPVIVTADADWQQIVETRFRDGVLISTPVGEYTGAESYADYLSC